MADTLCAWAATASFPPPSDPATLEQAASGLPVVAFDDAASPSEYRYFYGTMPGQYDGSSSVKIALKWLFATYVGSQTCDWEVSFCRLDDDVQSVKSFNFATAQTVLATEASADGELDYAEITFTNAQADGIQPNEDFVVKVLRDATGGTASPGDAWLTGMELKLAA
jgi:hypothetical protein